eukprot:887856-Prorocentrum_minimum.AAC.1
MTSSGPASHVFRTPLLPGLRPLHALFRTPVRTPSDSPGLWPSLTPFLRRMLRISRRIASESPPPRLMPPRVWCAKCRFSPSSLERWRGCQGGVGSEAQRSIRKRGKPKKLESHTR